jgi:hypothetical protein
MPIPMDLHVAEGDALRWNGLLRMGSIAALIMRRGRAFGRASAYAGIFAGAMGIVAVLLEDVSEALVPAAIPLYFAAIVFLLAWALLVGRRL